MAAVRVGSLGGVFKTQANNARILATSMNTAELRVAGSFAGMGAMVGGLGGGMMGAISPGNGRSRMQGAGRGMLRGAMLGAGMGGLSVVPWRRWGKPGPRVI